MLEEIIQSRFKQFTEPELIKEIVKHGKLRTCLENEVIIEPGQYIKFVPLIVYGSIRILRVEEEGREFYLYHLSPGQTCAISLSCCSSARPSEVKAIAEEDTEFITIPVELIDEWMEKYKSWKAFIMETYRIRFNELIRTIDNIAFLKLDERLEQYLKEKSIIQKSKEIATTHQQIADELGSSREVISRLLKQMEQKGMVTLGRNKLTLLL
jgi:CRP/FNR family transcriptional regulator